MSKPARNSGAQLGISRLLPILIFSALATGCSSEISRFDYPVFGFNGTDDSPTGSTISPQEPVYGSGGPDRGYSASPSSYSANTAQGRSDYGYSAPVAPVRRYDAPSYSNRADSSYSQPRDTVTYRPTRQVVGAQSPSGYPIPDANVAGANGTVTVRGGDTLYSIARSNNVSVGAIQQANGLSGTNISVGQRLVMPGRSAVARPRNVASGGGSYTVKAGDTVYSIARQHGVRHDELANANNLANPGDIKLGQTLVIPGNGTVTATVRSDRVREAALRPSPKKVRTQVIKPNDGSSYSNSAAPKAKPKRPETRVSRLPDPAPRAQGRFRWPVRGRIISKFGPKSNGAHNDGVNVAVPAGTSVKAVENGVVAYAGSELKGYGNLVLVRHADNWVSAYAHNEKLLVKRGDKITRGQVIAKSGRSGSVGQPQLHFELRKGSKPVDPMKYMAAL